MPTEVKVTPNFHYMFQQFLRDSMIHMERLSQPRRETCERADIYSFVASFRIALSCATTVREIEQLREAFDQAAEKMYAEVQKDNERREAQEEEVR